MFLKFRLFYCVGKRLDVLTDPLEIFWAVLYRDTKSWDSSYSIYRTETVFSKLKLSYSGF